MAPAVDDNKHATLPPPPPHLSLELRSASGLPAHPAAPERPNLAETLACMQYRKVFRQHRGAYVPPKPITFIILYWSMTFMLLADNFHIINTDEGIFLGFQANLFKFGTDGGGVSIELIVLLCFAIIHTKLQNRYTLMGLLPMLSGAAAVMAMILLLEYIYRMPQGDAGPGSNIATFIMYLYLTISNIYIVFTVCGRQLAAGEL